VFELRHSQNLANRAPLAELSVLLLCAGSVLLGFAAAERAELHLARVAVLSVVPVALLIRGLTGADLAVRRGHRTPLWVPGGLILGAVLVQATGGTAGILSPIAFLAVIAASIGCGFRRTLPWALLLIVVVVTPALVGWSAPSPMTNHLLFALGVLLCSVVPGRSLAAEREAHEATRARLKALDDETGGLRAETSQVVPAYRGNSYDRADRDRDLRTIARELQQDMDRACSLLVTATGASAASVFRPMGEDSLERLIVVASAGDIRTLVHEVDEREGIFGAAYKAGTPVLLQHPKEDDPRIAHRLDTSALGSVLAMPLVDTERRWGVMVLDCEDPDQITPEARSVAGNVADFVSRLIARAVDLSAIREGMRENHAFYEACREVSRHVKISDIARAVVSSAGEFVTLDACALALCDDEVAEIQVVSSVGFDPDPSATSFAIEHTEGLLAQSVRHQTPIDRPYLAMAHHPPLLFGRKLGPIKGLSSLLVLPILTPGGVDTKTLGAMVVARRSGANFAQEDLDRLQVLLHQVGAALCNGRLFSEHETRSITDGMTGLSNHGRFQDVLATKIAAADRTGLKLSLLLMDIDRFKNINDTYGHPAGDEVIRGLARVLESHGRHGTDLAARYGGEEFCLVLDDTDAQGAAVVADRLRQTFREEIFVYRDGTRPVTFHCTVSIGIACYPDDGASQTELIENADRALYVSKESGRDRTTCFGSTSHFVQTPQPMKSPHSPRH
jgi:diguanylate cyclase (GGDEF)-like protein